MRIVKVLFSVIIVSTFGCASQKPVTVTIPQDAKIGIMYLIDERPRHVHVGTTVFNNFTKMDVSDWSVRQALTDHIRKEILSKYNFTILEIEPTSVLMENRTNLYKLGWNRMYLKEEYVSEIFKVTKDLNIDFLITIEPFNADVEGHTPVSSDGYGLLTRCTIGYCYAKGLNHVASKVYAMKPPKIISWSKSLTYYSSDLPIEIDFSNGIKNLPKTEIDKAKEPVIQFMKERIDSALERSPLIDKSNKKMQATQETVHLIYAFGPKI